MTAPETTRPRPERDADRPRRLFVLARAQLTANGAEPLRRDLERRRSRPHRRRFSSQRSPNGQLRAARRV